MFAAAVAAALTPEATIDDVIEAALAVAHDGTGRRSRPWPPPSRAWPATRIRPTVWQALRVGGPPVRHGGRRLPRPGSGCPAAQPHQVDRGASGGPRLLSAQRRRLRGPRCWMRSTTAGTPTRSPPWPEPSAAGWAGSGVIPAEWVREVDQASRIDLDAVADRLARRRPRSSRRTWRRPRRGGSGWAHCSARLRPPWTAGRSRVRLTWVQPEDLLLQEFVQARTEGARPQRTRGTLARRRRGIAGSAGERRGRRTGPPGAARAGRTAAGRARRAAAPADPRHPDDWPGSRRPGRCSRPNDPARRRSCRPAARRLVRSSGRLPARQTGREDSPRRDPGDRPRRPATGRSAATSPRAVCRPTSRPAGPGTRRVGPDQPGREHRRDAGGRRPELPAARLAVLERHGPGYAPRTSPRPG